MQPVWRLIPLNSPSGALWNMAVDETLLENFSGVPTLRLYRWSERALSIGYFQSPQAVCAAYENLSEAVIVRRITGGGVVRHGDDLTASIILPEDNPFFPRRAVESYAAIHRLLLDCLKSDHPGIALSVAGPTMRPRSLSSCFEEPVAHDLSWKGNKVVGSSQRRRHGVLLHQTCVRLPGDPRCLAARVGAGFEAAFGTRFDVTGITPEEASHAQMLVHEKYSREDFSLILPFRSAPK